MMEHRLHLSTRENRRPVKAEKCKKVSSLLGFEIYKIFLISRHGLFSRKSTDFPRRESAPCDSPASRLTKKSKSFVVICFIASTSVRVKVGRVKTNIPNILKLDF